MMLNAGVKTCQKLNSPLVLSCRMRHDKKSYSFKKHQGRQMTELKLKNRTQLESSKEVGVQDFTFDFTTIEAQMESLKTKGFMRKYKAYAPPENLQTIFLQTCSSVLGKELSMSDLATTKLSDPGLKFRLLNDLSSKLNHTVHNSRLRDMDALDKVYKFYSTQIDMKNPYDRLHDRKEAGDLPPNLHIQKHAIRFTGRGEHELDKVTAFPRSSTVVSGLYTRDKFPEAKQQLDIHSELDYD